MFLSVEGKSCHSYAQNSSNRSHVTQSKNQYPYGIHSPPPLLKMFVPPLSLAPSVLTSVASLLFLTKLNVLPQGLCTGSCFSWNNHRPGPRDFLPASFGILLPSGPEQKFPMTIPYKMSTPHCHHFSCYPL